MALPHLLLESLVGLPGFNRQAFEDVHAGGGQVTSLRMNPAKWTYPDISKLLDGFKTFQSREIRSSAIPWCTSGYYLDHRPSFTFDPYFHAGAYYVQEASSMFIGYAIEKVCAGQKNIKALDLCAAPGGKSTQLSSIDNISLLVSNEIIRGRLPVLYENMVKWGAPHVFITHDDPRNFQRLPSYFNLLLVDAPCSGSGLFRRDPDAVREWSPQAVSLCSHRQQRILSDALPALQEDGILLYSTCSYSVEEDEFILDWLMQHEDMETVKIDFPEDWGIVETVSRQFQAYGYRFYPDKIKGEGFFMGCLRKKKQANTVLLKTTKPQYADNSMKDILQSWIKDDNQMQFIMKNDDLLAIPDLLIDDYLVLAANLALRKSGTRIGQIIRGKLNPDHELAMSQIRHPDIPFVEVSYEEAILYLQKQTFSMTFQRLGWNLIQFDFLPLGFIKSMPNRMNNYYPAEWRILSDRPQR